MKVFARVSVLCLAVSVSLPAQAGLGRFRQRMVMGSDAAQNEQSLLSLNWQTDRSAALQQAKAEGKLVFWVHMLGRIDGST